MVEIHVNIEIHLYAREGTVSAGRPERPYVTNYKIPDFRRFRAMLCIFLSDTNIVIISLLNAGTGHSPNLFPERCESSHVPTIQSCTLTPCEYFIRIFNYRVNKRIL